MEGIQEWISKGKTASEKIKKVERLLKSGEIEINVEDSKLTYENRHNLNEVELYALQEKYKVPKLTYFSIAGYTIGYFSLATYLFIKKGKNLVSKLIPKHRMTLGNMVLKGTYIATGGVGLYAILGYFLVKQLNIYEQYMMYTRIRGEMVDRMLREDEALQKVYLFDNMMYYGMPEDMIQRARDILKERREKLKREKALLIFLVEDEEESQIEGDLKE